MYDDASNIKTKYSRRTCFHSYVLFGNYFAEMLNCCLDDITSNSKLYRPYFFMR